MSDALMEEFGSLLSGLVRMLFSPAPNGPRKPKYKAIFLLFFPSSQWPKETEIKSYIPVGLSQLTMAQALGN